MMFTQLAKVQFNCFKIGLKSFLNSDKKIIKN